jgi:hypothetical protein
MSELAQVESTTNKLLYGGAVISMSPEIDGIYLGLKDELFGLEGIHQHNEPRVFTGEGTSVPTRLEELNMSQSHVYDLSVTAAQELSIPVIGTVSGGQSRRVVVLEAKRWKDVEESSSTIQYGYAIRLAITTNKLDVNMKLNLAYLAASAQVGLIEASWTMYCIGLSGKPVDSALIPPKELTVETFVLAKQSLEQLLNAVWDPATTFSAVKIAETMNADQLRKEYYKNIARAYALGRIERGKTLTQAINELGAGQPVFAEFVSEFYRSFVGIITPSDSIPPQARQRARAFLQTVDVITRN